MAPVIENERLGSADGPQQAGMASVITGDGKGLEQAWHAIVEDGVAVTASLVAERTGDPSLSKAGRPCDQRVLVPVDPAAMDQLGYDGAVDPARGAQVDVLCAGGLPEGDEFQRCIEPPCFAAGGFAVERRHYFAAASYDAD